MRWYFQTDGHDLSIIYSLYVICVNCTQKKITAILRHIPNHYQPTGRKHCTPNHREISASLSNGTDRDGGCDSFYYFHSPLWPSSRTCEFRSIVMHVRNCQAGCYTAMFYRTHCIKYLNCNSEFSISLILKSVLPTNFSAKYMCDTTLSLCMKTLLLCVSIAL